MSLETQDIDLAWGHRQTSSLVGTFYYQRLETYTMLKEFLPELNYTKDEKAAELEC